MRALSLVRPLPWAILNADCLVIDWLEEITHRGDIAIRASKRWDSKALLRVQRTASGVFGCSGVKTAHPADAIVAVAEIVDCIALADLQSRGAAWRRQATWAQGPWCAVISNVRRTRLVPCSGARGWFNVDDAIVAEALRAA
ncbi:MAG: hypothetical protein JWO85_3666 [Candidatus Eremiobacteraeota bacterium]|nr:hypothetical protein [Candidatus Eremiobacteraeota bacterium]